MKWSRIREGDRERERLHYSVITVPSCHHQEPTTCFHCVRGGWQLLSAFLVVFLSMMLNRDVFPIFISWLRFSLQPLFHTGAIIPTYSADMVVRSIGNSLMVILPELLGKKITAWFDLVRPLIAFKFQTVSLTHFAN